MPKALPTISFRAKALAWLMAIDRSPNSHGELDSTQAGIANATGLSRAHVSRTLEPLVESDLVKATRRRVPGFARTLIAYSVTEAGRREFDGLTAELGKTVVDVRAADGFQQRMPLAQALARASPRPSWWDAIQQLESHGHLLLDGSAERRLARHVREGFEPIRQEHFVGRQPELVRLHGWLASKGGVYVLEGPGGVGKTSLVHEALRDQRPPRHVRWFDLSEWTTTRTLLQAFERFFASLGRPGHLPAENPEELAEDIATRAKGFPILLVFDDVDKADVSVRAFLSTTLRVLARSRNLHVALVGRAVDLAGERRMGATLERLQPLSMADSITYLARRGLAPSECERLANIAGGLPLFLDVLARYPAGPPPEETGREVFRGLVDRLSEIERETLRAATISRVPVTPGMLRDLQVGSTQSLETLRNAGLLTLRGDDAFQPHDLVRQAVQAGLGVVEERRLHLDFVEYYSAARDSWGDVTEYLHHLVRAGRRADAVRWVLSNRTAVIERSGREGPPT